MVRAANISVILEKPSECQNKFNETVSEFNHLIRGRMGIPFENIALISLTVIGELDEINTFTGLLGRIKGISVKANVSKENMAMEVKEK